MSERVATAESVSAPSWRLVGGATALGVAYLLVIVFREYLSHRLLGVSSHPTVRYVETQGTDQQVTHLFLKGAPLLIAAIVAKRHLTGLRLFIALPPARSGLTIVAATMVISLALNAFSLWPFSWRWADDSSRAYMAALRAGNQLWGIVAWGITTMLVAPFLEELLFRFGLLQIVYRLSGSASLAVLTTSLLFSLGHVGYLPFTMSERRAYTMFWMFIVSLYLGFVVLRNGGRIGTSILIHSSRNSIEFISLVIAI